MTIRRSIACQIVGLALFAASTTAHAQPCEPAQFDAVIDETGEHLRQFSAKSQPALHAKFERLGATRNWPSQDAIDRGYQFVSDKRTADLDQRARKLLIELHSIGDPADGKAGCPELARLRSVAEQLREVTAAKFAHMSLKVDQALAEAPAAVAKAPAPKAPATKPPALPAKTATEPSPAIKSARKAIGKSADDRTKPPAKKQQARKAPFKPTIPPATSWESRTQVTLAPPPQIQPPESVPPASLTFSAQEINEAGRGFFGSISASLASVIRHAFKNYGQPNGYILGNEGGGAFLAGVSYGDGTLVTKAFGRQRVYWQGPTVGYDLGVTGSRVMFLVYRLNRADQIFSRFVGIGGSAFVVGGVGITYHKRGSLVLAPIRTGIGLRLGANIGYLKFTPRPTLNPF